jgi:addiction module RelE/StbE family toxin
MSVRYTREALQDVDEIASYIAERNPRAAAKVVEAVEAVVARLDRFPLSAPHTEMPGIRSASALRFPYIIFYSVEEHGVPIHYVRHAARRRPWEHK